MIDEAIKHLPPPDPDAPDRIYKRLQQSRRSKRRVLPWAMGVLAVSAGALMVGVAAYLWTADQNRVVRLTNTTEQTQWSDVIAMTPEGQGTAEGTNKMLNVHWRQGTISLNVAPNQGSDVTITTDESVTKVVGTVFAVTRDRLGATTRVERGKVQLTCTDGWSGYITKDSGPHTCLPTTAAGLLGRADLLNEQGASATAQYETVSKGIQLVRATDDVVLSELLFRRINLADQLGHTEQARADAQRYLTLPNTPRKRDAERFLAWSQLKRDGCHKALDSLQALAAANDGVDVVVLAECLAGLGQPFDQLLTEDVVSNLSPQWQQRAKALLVTP